MKKIIWILVVLVFIGYLVISNQNSVAKREAKKAEVKEIEHDTYKAVSQLVNRTTAIKDWDSKLSRGKVDRWQPILTFELEKLWLQPRPILFPGAIKDIASLDQLHYTITIERNAYGNFKHRFDTELQLSLVSSKKIIDVFLEKHPDLFKEYIIENNVAVVARVKSIRTIDIPGEEGKYEQIKIGDGDLIEIMFTGDVEI